MLLTPKSLMNSFISNEEAIDPEKEPTYHVTLFLSYCLSLLSSLTYPLPLIIHRTKNKEYWDALTTSVDAN